MTLVVAPAVISARWSWIRVLQCRCGRTAIRYLCLVGLEGTLVRLGTSPRRLVHSLLGPGPVTSTAGVMHRPPVNPAVRSPIYRCIFALFVRSTANTTYLVFIARRPSCGSILTLLSRSTSPAAFIRGLEST